MSPQARRYAIATVISPEGATDRTVDWRCPDCGSFLDRTVAGQALNQRNLVRLEQAERDGVPCYGLRRGAFLRGRSPIRKNQTDNRVFAAMDHGRSDYRLIDQPVFDTFCGSCRGRVRIDAT